MCARSLAIGGLRDADLVVVVVTDTDRTHCSCSSRREQEGCTGVMSEGR